MIPFDDRDGYIWFDGDLCPWRDAKVHFLTHSLHYGGAVFEGIRVYDGKIFKLTEHIERLLGSCNIMDMESPFTVDEIIAACQRVIEANKVQNGYIRPLVWRGAEEMGISAKNTKVHCGVATWEWPNYFGEQLKKKGIRVMTSSWKRPSPDSAPSHAKASGLYMISTLAKHAADRAGFDDALMLDYRGNVVELSSCNFFYVKNGELFTAIPDCFLNGITRLTVIDIAKAKGIKVNEKQISPEELKTADECFATGTAVEIIPISQIDSNEYKVGTLTKELIDEYDKLVRSN